MPEAEKREPSRLLTVLLATVFVAYLVVLVKITVVKGTTVPRLLAGLLDGRAPLQAVNLVPFQTIADFARLRHEMSALRVFANLFGNMLVFVPFGLYLPLLVRRLRGFRGVVLATLALSASLEGLQYLLGTGSTDIDDLWLNALGSVIGYLLFRSVVRVTPTRPAALAAALAASVVFAGAGYATAYREFGLYLGLAKLREDVQGAQRIPDRAPEAIGTIRGTRDGALVLDGLARRAGATDTSGAVPPAAPAAPRGIAVRVSPETRFYDRHDSLDGHTQRIRYTPYAPTALAQAPDGAFARVWGRWHGDALMAEVVATTRPAARIGGTSVVAVSTTRGGPVLPTTRPSLRAHFQRFAGDTAVALEIRVIEMGSSSLATSTRTEATFRVSPTTVYIRRRILNAGRDVTLFEGSRADLVPRAMLEVWGREREGMLVADVVCVNVFR